MTDKSPALAAGIKTGDTIVKLGSEEVSDARDLAKKVARYSPGKTIDLTVVRDGKTMNVPVEIGKMPGDDKVASNGGGNSEQQHSNLAGLGLLLAPAEDGAGVKVIEVKPDSPAEARGLKAGDIILEVAGSEVHDPADVKAALQGMKSGDKRVLMLVRSGDGQRFVALPVGQG